MTQKKRTYVAIVLDNSGSMQSIRQEAINHFNEQVQQMRAQTKRDPSLDIIVSLVLFNYQVEVTMDNLNLDYVKEITFADYTPDGGTALYDGIERAIQLIQPKLKPEDAALVVVITDGEENSSTPHNRQSVPGKIKELQGTDQWTFTYMGTSKDLTKFTQEVGASAGNVFYTSFSKDAMETVNATATRGLHTNYFNARSAGARSVSKAYVDSSVDVSSLPTSPSVDLDNSSSTGGGGPSS